MLIQEAYVEIASELLTTTVKLEKELASILQEATQTFGDSLTDCISPLAVSASKQQIIDAETHVINRFEELREAHKDSFQLVETRVQVVLSLFRQVEEMAEIFASTRGLAQADKKDLDDIKEQAKDGLRVYGDVSAESRDLKAQNLLQIGLREIVTGQSEEMKKWYYERLADKFAGHILPYRAVKRVITDVRGGVSKIPAEIMALVYSYCDVESCSTLRQVDTSWNAVFHNIEPVLRSKLAERNPWLKPDGKDLQTWADCVVLFTARMEWPSTWMGQLEKVKPVKTTRKTVATHSLECDEPLPSNFEAMLPLDIQCTAYSQACDHIHLASFHNDHILDLRTYQPVNMKIPPEIDMPVVRVKDFEITLSPQTSAEDIEDSHLSVRVFTKTAGVHFKDGSVLAVSRDKPSYEHGYTFDSNGADLCECGGVLFAGTGLTGGQELVKMVDIENKRTYMHPPSGSDSGMVGAHKGLIWWCCDGTLVPTFYDLKNPKKVHYNPKRVFENSETPKKWTQAKGDSCKYMAMSVKSGVDLLDLDTGVVTHLRGAKDGIVCIPGFIDGKFHAYSQSLHVQDENKRTAWEALGIPEEAWYSD